MNPLWRRLITLRIVTKQLEAEIRITHERLAHDVRTVVQVRMQQLVRVFEEPRLALLVVVPVRILPQDLHAVHVVEYAQAGAVASALRGREGGCVCHAVDFGELGCVDAEGWVYGMVVLEEAGKGLKGWTYRRTVCPMLRLLLGLDGGIWRSFPPRSGGRCARCSRADRTMLLMRQLLTLVCVVRVQRNYILHPSVAGRLRSSVVGRVRRGTARVEKAVSVPSTAVLSACDCGGFRHDYLPPASHSQAAIVQSHVLRALVAY